MAIKNRSVLDDTNMHEIVKGWSELVSADKQHEELPTSEQVESAERMMMATETANEKTDENSGADDIRSWIGGLLDDLIEKSVKLATKNKADTLEDTLLVELREKAATLYQEWSNLEVHTFTKEHNLEKREKILLIRKT